MTPAELRDAERLVDLLIPQLEQRRTRRYELHSHGRRLAPRAMFRRNLGTGGQLMSWVWRRPISEPRSIVVICDISGSMERHSRLLLRFVQALSSASEVRTESFVFGTRLTRVTRLLGTATAIARWPASPRRSTTGPAGRGSARASATFNQHWARRTLRTSGVVIVVSDGWDRGDPALVAAETARLRRNCHRLVWLNPLAGTPGYQPLAGGMRAAFPYIDDFLPAGTVASLERLGEILGGVRSADIPAWPEAAAHAAMPGAAPVDLPTAAAGRRRRRTTARPAPARGRCDEGAPRHARRPGRPRATEVGRAVVVRTFGSAPRPEGAVLLVRRRRPDRRVGQRRLRRGRRRRGDRARPRTGQPGSSATASATSRPGTSGWPAAARSMSSSSRPCRPSRSMRPWLAGAGGHGWPS